jgi:hypothetical protein
MKFRDLPLIASFFVFYLPCGLAEQPTGKPSEKAIVVPFETLASGHVAVKIKVNGKGPYRVIFDTGAPINLLNNKLAAETGLLKGAPKSMLPFVGAIAEVKVKELEVGNAKATEQHALVMDHPLLKLMAKKLGPLDGIVGFPFFGCYRLTIDYQTETLTLVPNGYKPANVTKLLETKLLRLLTSGTQPMKVLAPAAQWGLTAQKKADDEEAGVDIQAVLAGSAAAEAGLKVGDRLLTIDGRWTDSLADLYEIASHLKPGATIPLGIKRAGKEMELKITLRAGL